jgi:hypothetical protein
MEIDKSVIICALARDCSDALKSNIPRIDRLRSFFRSSEVVVIENDSKDSTKETLLEWQRNSLDIHLLMDDHRTETLKNRDKNNRNPGTSVDRIQKMSTYRNQYLTWLDKNGKNPDYVIIVDIDVLSFSIEGILNSIIYAPANWGGLFANGYTDSRIRSKIFHRLYHDLYAFSEKKPISGTYLTHAEMFKNSKAINRKLKSSSYLPVFSAFGGIGIYKFEAIKGLRYEAIKNNDKLMEAVCEHIPYNLAIRDRGFGNYVSRDLDVYYGDSNKIMVLRNLMPLPIFKLLAFMITFKWLKA